MIKQLSRFLFGAFLMVLATAGLAAEHEVKMLNQGPQGTMSFDPAYLKVAPGDTVKFVPTDQGHNSHSVLVPKGATTWQGQISKPVTVTLNKQGVYIYQCDPHHTLGMVGVIQVGKAGNLKAAKKKAAEMESNMAMNKGRLTKDLDKVK